MLKSVRLVSGASRLCCQRTMLSSRESYSQCRTLSTTIATTYASSTKDSKGPEDLAKPQPGSVTLQPHVKDSWATRMYKKYIDKTSKRKIKASGYVLSSYCTTAVKLDEFFDFFDMPDTYFSWFLVTELHVWMLSARAMAGKTTEGEVLRNALIEALWKDCQERMKLLVELPSSDRQELVFDIAEEFQASLLLYDNGIVNDDMELANSLWRRFFLSGKPDAPKIELLVKYVRQTMQMLDEIPLADLIEKQRVTWLSLEAVNASS